MRRTAQRAPDTVPVRSSCRLGHGGRKPFTELVLGSTTTGLAAHVECPVVAVRGTTAPTGPLVLGVDGSPSG
ncbi:universal stress protein [Streptomyces sp. NPDC058783]|uniref:universal stress protein n=1 Tax=Streptomyces TaxID=1883 RepID=UPI0035ABE3E3